ncbi:hypothetical protein DENSPDRAFT_885151 [Dentipellis sp. KUC8613]|nr:hypothetical protein DENSPDRAFT_885151 [Dentipellis sp. KUC8613]
MVPDATDVAMLQTLDHGQAFERYGDRAYTEASPAVYVLLRRLRAPPLPLDAPRRHLQVPLGHLRPTLLGRLCLTAPSFAPRDHLPPHAATFGPRWAVCDSRRRLRASLRPLNAPPCPLNAPPCRPRPTAHSSRPMPPSAQPAAPSRGSGCRLVALVRPRVVVSPRAAATCAHVDVTHAHEVVACPSCVISRPCPHDAAPPPNDAVSGPFADASCPCVAVSPACTPTTPPPPPSPPPPSLVQRCLRAPTAVLDCPPPPSMPSPPPPHVLHAPYVPYAPYAPSPPSPPSPPPLRAVHASSAFSAALVRLPSPSTPYPPSLPPLRAVHLPSRFTRSLLTSVSLSPCPSGAVASPRPRSHSPPERRPAPLAMLPRAPTPSGA